MSRAIGARPPAVWRKPPKVRLDRDSVSGCWLLLPGDRAVPLFVVMGTTSVRLAMRVSTRSPCMLVGRFDRNIPLADLIQEVRHTAEELASTMNMQVAA